MGTIQLLDCTLRDGGYLNDWKFGHDNIVSMFERLVDSGIEMIEVGFLDQRRSFDINRTIMPDTASVEKILGGLDRKQALVFGMIDFGTCDISHIQPCAESYLDGIRVIFKEHLREPAMAYIRQLKELGYLVTAQLVSVTTYTEETMLDLIRLANEVKPYAVSMVDTYGLMHQNNLKHFYNLLEEHLDQSIAIGYHGHNNFQMGYANCIEMLSYSKNSDRTILVDGTLYGMGKSAGNAPVELISMHMNHVYGKHYDISQMLEAIDANVRQFHHASEWGYNMFYYLSALNDCHPNYVQYLLNTRSLSVKQLNELLGRLQGKKKLLYDKSYIEQLYRDFITEDINDRADLHTLRTVLAGKKLLVVGPGMNMKRQADRVQAYVAENAPIVLSVNYLPQNLKADYLFLSNSKRFVQLASTLHNSDIKVIATSNVTSMSRDFEYRVNIAALLDQNALFVDNSLMMLIKLLMRLGVSEAALAGFDGYSQHGENYFDSSKEYTEACKQAEYLNLYMSMFLSNAADQITVHFVTDTKYQVCKNQN